ncbi:hypothetical protein ACFL2Q_04790, partial [Thermodesulfobacteriota bacterium]
GPFVALSTVSRKNSPKTSPNTAECKFDVGQDTGTPVSARYKDHVPFKGELDKVDIKLAD